VTPLPVFRIQVDRFVLVMRAVTLVIFFTLARFVAPKIGLNESALGVKVS